MTKRLTTELFIEKAKKVHGEKYDYSHVNYINTLTKVKIICPEHGEFVQTPNNHLQGRGCRKCGTNNVTKLKNDFYKDIHEGETSYNNHNRLMKIERYGNYEDIDVVFEDGSKVHTSYEYFKRGDVKHPNEKSVSKLGMMSINKHGRTMKIVKYTDSNHLDVVFDDGVIVKNKTLTAFKKGSIAHPNDKFDSSDRIGQEFYTNNGEHVRIVEYKNAKDVSVVFDDGTVRNCKYSTLKTGQLLKKNRNHSDDEALDFIDLYEHNYTKLCSLYPDKPEKELRRMYLYFSDKYKHSVDRLKRGTLEEEFPSLVKEYAQDQNTIPLSEVTCGSHRKVWWLCPNGHYYFMSISNKANRGHSCPYCSNNRLGVGINDLKTVFPDIAKEWDYNKNNRTAENYMYTSSKKVWWKCSDCGHEWEARIRSRTINGVECPNCKRTNSKGETIIANYFNRVGVKYIKNYPVYLHKDPNPKFFDFYVPNYGFVEFDGMQHFKPVTHFGGEQAFEKRREFDSRKTQYCRDNNISLLRIRFDQLELLDDMLRDFITNNTKYKTRYNTYISDNEYYLVT